MPAVAAGVQHEQACAALEDHGVAIGRDRGVHVGDEIAGDARRDAAAEVEHHQLTAAVAREAVVDEGGGLGAERDAEGQREGVIEGLKKGVAEGLPVGLLGELTHTSATRCGPSACVESATTTWQPATCAPTS